MVGAGGGLEGETEEMDSRIWNQICSVAKASRNNLSVYTLRQSNQQLESV